MEGSSRSGAQKPADVVAAPGPPRGEIVSGAPPRRAASLVLRASPRRARRLGGRPSERALTAPALLAPLRAKGAATGVLHPLAVAGAGGAPLRASYARIEGAPRARAVARAICKATAMIPLHGAGLKTPSGRRSYHAAASLASN